VIDKKTASKLAMLMVEETRDGFLLGGWVVVLVVLARLVGPIT
jgi:hypothetical protein